ncbi:all-trans-retinol 13,14-reductase [Parabacteroides sp. PFB2-10]|uniref:phytoene desaturase family protein n=1 Tax=Parabacteroides sp. PFB2-10 TaxID=1742405 RepID=UPI0024752970|nr:NAD(P)/FAD-dependent oxidoreductase [Parabacteroides sp. PFB2-10]MDH6313337.1 all-trans-retinol 13,14-reductase [Parabacteroides sp. PFB2-10]MDL2244827.1 NAD(P)/FAD-dependent oxidoreductase [Parabacteroides sp. OttesenSCG-928-J18]
MSKYDIVIIGSGLGGLTCAATLSKEGYHVCLLEKNTIPGGCFQSFRRNGRLLDTGIHYVGSLDEGEILRQYFSYFGIWDRLQVRRLDEEAFDLVNYQGKEYPYAMGHELFIKRLSDLFPGEKEAIRRYTELLKRVGETISVDQLKKGHFTQGSLDHFSVSAWETIASVTQNPALRQVLSSPALLYGGDQATSTFYHHAMITDSYLRGAYRFTDGSMQVVDALIDQIRRQGGTVLTGAKATRLLLQGDKINAVEINHSERLEADYVISSLHPSVTMQMVDKTPLIRKAYLSRLSHLPNTYGLLSVYLIQKKGTTPYQNSNLFLHEKEDVWYTTKHPEDRRIHSVLITMQPSASDPEHTDVISILSPMYIGELTPWLDTTPEKRGDAYLGYKEQKAEEVLAFVGNYYPEIRDNIERIYITTPLSYRDYTGIPDGSAYGIMKNYNQPMTTVIPNRTRINNLYLTGQNLNVHGALGVTLTSMLTCGELVGTEYLAKKIAKG